MVSRLVDCLFGMRRGRDREGTVLMLRSRLWMRFEVDVRRSDSRWKECEVKE
jgi:hypothetical protein